jgi:hypothetical protein
MLACPLICIGAAPVSYRRHCSELQLIECPLMHQLNRGLGHLGELALLAREHSRHSLRALLLSFGWDFGLRVRPCD